MTLWRVQTQQLTSKANSTQRKFASKKDTTNAGMSKVTLPHQDLANHHFKKKKSN